MKNNYLRIIKYVLIYISIMILAVIAHEVIDIYNDLSQINPLLGISFLLIMVVPFLYFVIKSTILWIKLPKVVIPPHYKPSDQSAKAKQRYQQKVLKYAHYHAANLKQNKNLNEQDKLIVDQALTSLNNAVKSGKKDLNLNQIWSNELELVHQKLNNEARKIISYSALGSAVSVGVSQSPVIDMILQLNAMLKLTNDVIEIYWAHPSKRVMLSIYKDAIISSLGLFSMSYGSESNLAKGMIKGLGTLINFKLPGAGDVVGIIGEDVLQGLVSMSKVRKYGFMLQERCIALEWTNRPETSSLKDRLEKIINFFNSDETDSATVTNDKEKEKLVHEETLYLLREFSWSGARNEQDNRVVVFMVNFINQKVRVEDRVPMLSKVLKKPSLIESITEKHHSNYDIRSLKQFRDYTTHLYFNGASESEKLYLDNINKQIDEKQRNILELNKETNDNGQLVIV